MYTAKQIISILRVIAAKTDGQNALARQLGINPRYVSAALLDGYIHPSVASAIGFEEVEKLYKRKKLSRSD